MHRQQDFVSEEIVVRGRGWSFVIFAIILSGIALAMPAVLTASGNRLPWNNVIQIWMIVAVVDVIILLIAGYLSSRRLVLRRDDLCFFSLFSSRAWPVSEITDLSRQTDAVVSTEETVSHQEYLVFWAKERELIRINLAMFDRRALRQLVQALKARQPSLVMSPEARRLFA